MGWRQTDYTHTGVNATEFASMALTKGTLVAATANQIHSVGPPWWSWATLYLSGEDTNQRRAYIVLAEGYINNLTPISWHGMLPCKEGDFLVVAFSASSGAIIRLSSYVQDPRTSATGVPRDP